MPVLAADIGGTNATLAILEGTDILHEERCETATIDDFSAHVNAFLRRAGESGHHAAKACIAVAGPVQDGRIEMTNAQLIIDASQLHERTVLAHVRVINDFEALAAATEVLEADGTVELNAGEPQQQGARAIIGAGTGLGKAYLTLHEDISIVHASEGGHVTLATEHAEERVFAQELEQRDGYPAEYEDVLSGRGLEAIYDHLQRGKYHDAHPGLSAERISRSRLENACSKESFVWFVRFFARCARNYTLDVLATGGIWIAGGIAAKNVDAFTESFTQHFTEHRKYEELLEKIPVRIITDPRASLKGAAALLEDT